MKNLSDMILEADENQNNQDNSQGNANKPVKVDAGTYKEWPVFKTTMRGWVKVMSGQEDAKETFFSNGFLVPIAAQLVNSNAATATLSKQLDSEVTVKISEYKSDYMFTIVGLKPYGYTSTGWSKGKGPAIADMIKSMKAELTNKNKEQDDNGNDNGQQSSGGTM